MLSTVNHKNFINLLGFCDESSPFTRMMVFEYAANGTLYEHLHGECLVLLLTTLPTKTSIDLSSEFFVAGKEAEPLDWEARMRIAMGIAYCLEHMIHKVKPPLILRNLDSSSVYLTEDFAAKVSDNGYFSAAVSENSGVLNAQLTKQEDIVLKFGVLLLEIMSGQLPFSGDAGLLVTWASSFPQGMTSFKDFVDPMLEPPRDEYLTAICRVVLSCIRRDPETRPTMDEIAGKLREITGISPSAAAPSILPLWWAVLQALSTDFESDHTELIEL